jgi:hypothetical protein
MAVSDTFAPGDHCRIDLDQLLRRDLSVPRDADLAGLIAAGRGDTPLVQLRWRCAACGSRRIDMVCPSHARVVPWRSEQAPALP